VRVETLIPVLLRRRFCGAQAATLSEFAANPRWLGGIAAFTLVLHTWTQDLRRHLHVHALMACGALAAKPSGYSAQWVTPTRSSGFLFPVRALSRVFRGKFSEMLATADRAAILTRDPASSAEMQRARQTGTAPSRLGGLSPLAGPAAVIDYLSRYTHRNCQCAVQVILAPNKRMVPLGSRHDTCSA